MQPLLVFALTVLCACSGTARVEDAASQSTSTSATRGASGRKGADAAAAQPVAAEQGAAEAKAAEAAAAAEQAAEATAAAEQAAEAAAAAEQAAEQAAKEAAAEAEAAAEQAADGAGAVAESASEPTDASDATQAQDAPPAADGAGGAEAEPKLDVPGLVRADAPQPPLVSIPDIDKHRTQALPYVRTREAIVEVGLGALDIDADPILVVDGEPVSRAAFRRRALMYTGENEIDKHVTRLLTDKQIERELARGADPALFELQGDDVDRKLAELKELVRMQAMQPAQAAGPDDDAAARGEAAVQAYMDTIESSIGMDAYLKLLSADAQFERVFLPFPEGKVEGDKHDFEQGPPPADDPKPDWMPQESWDALGSDEQGVMLRTFLKTWAIDGSGIPAMFKPNLLSKVRTGLLQSQGVRFFFDADLPDDVLLAVGDELVRTDDLWPLVLPHLVDTDVKLIVREMLTLRAARKALDAAGKWLDAEQFAAAWKAENDLYANTLLPLQTMIMFRGYSSLDRYREHFRYRQSYNEWRKETLTDDEVMAHYQGGGRLMFERGSVVADVMYAPLDGLPFNDASLMQRQEELGAAIEAARGTGEGWVGPVVERYPPPPPQQGMDAHSMQRSQLRMRMAESELSILVTGYSLADDVFYHGRAGDVYGPWAERCRRHAFGAEANAGAWAVSVRDFSRRSPLPPFDGQHRDLAYQDFLDLHFFHWAQESLQALLPGVSLPAH